MASSNQMKTSPKLKSSSKTARPSTSKVGRPSSTGHKYVYLDDKVDNDQIYTRSHTTGRKITVTLKDLTTGKVITRRGGAKMGKCWLDNLEGHTHVYLKLEWGNQEIGTVKTCSGSSGCTGEYELSK